jgi:drug/metabolite transporter (DMT)-like permease
MSELKPTTFSQGLMSQPYVLLVLCTLFWGGNSVAGKAAVGNIDPYLLSALRWGGALLLLLPFAWRTLPRDWPAIKGRWWLYLFYGAAGFGLFNVLLYLAAYFTSAVNISLNQVAINILVLLGNFVIYRVGVRPLQIGGILLTIAGVAVTATHGDLTRLLSLELNHGDALMLLACVAYAAYSILLRYRPATDWKSFIAVTFLIATVTSLVFAAVVDGGLGQMLAAIPEVTPLGWAIAIYALLFPSLISQMFYVRGVELIGANRASLFINLIPLFGAVGAVLILGEPLELFHMVAGALVIVGIGLAEWSARRS